jgi:hypothetical protein
VVAGVQFSYFWCCYCPCCLRRRQLSWSVGRLNELEAAMAKITGIGGVFLKCKGDSAALAAWYQTTFGYQHQVWPS